MESKSMERQWLLDRLETLSVKEQNQLAAAIISRGQLKALSEKTGEEREAELDEQFYIDGYNLDVDQLVGSELILNMPIRVLCREDCKGISDRYGTNPGSEEGGEEAALDPRMSVIQDIFKQMKEV